MMELCENCKMFYVNGNDNCYNCGSNALELKRFKRRFLAGETIVACGLMAFVILVFEIFLWVITKLDKTIFNLLGRIPFLLIIGMTVTFIICLFALNIIFGLKIFNTEKKPKKQIFHSENFEESLLFWEQQITTKLKEINSQINEIQIHLTKFSLTNEEKDSFSKAQKLLFNKKYQAQLKLNSFKVIRWVNTVEEIFSIAQSGADEKEIDQVFHKIDIRKPEGKALLTLELDANTKEILQQSISKLENLKTEMARKKSLFMLQNIRAGVGTGDNVPENLLNQKERLELTDGSMDRIEADMFLKENFRLEVLEILER